MTCKPQGDGRSHTGGPLEAMSQAGAGFHISKPGGFGPNFLGKVLYGPSFKAALF